MQRVVFKYPMCYSSMRTKSDCFISWLNELISMILGRRKCFICYFATLSWFRLIQTWNSSNVYTTKIPIDSNFTREKKRKLRHFWQKKLSRGCSTRILWANCQFFLLKYKRTNSSYFVKNFNNSSLNNARRVTYSVTSWRFYPNTNDFIRGCSGQFLCMG